jgi:hypothetical protein
VTSGLEASLRLSADVIRGVGGKLLFVFFNSICAGHPQFQLTVETTRYTEDHEYIHCLTLYKFRPPCRIREYGGNCQGSYNIEEACVCLEFSVCFACCPVPTRRGESGTNYRGPAIRKGARGFTMLQMFWSVSVLSLFVDYTN